MGVFSWATPGRRRMTDTMTRNAACSILLLMLSGVAISGAKAQETWQIGEEPILVIGTADGPSESVFHDVRGVVIADDTLIVVADGGSRQLRAFTTGGDPVAVFGGVGDGPEEFRTIGWSDRCGMSAITVYDLHRRRVTRWDPHGNLLDGFNIESTDPGRPAYSLDCGPTGDFAVVGWFDVLRYNVEPGPYRPETNVGVLGPDGRLREVLGSFPGPERYRYPRSDGLSDGPRPLGMNTIARMGPDGVVVGTGDSYEIELFRTDGGSFTFGRPHDRNELTDEMLEVWRDSILSGRAPQNRAEVRRALEAQEMPETLPAYSDFRFDELGLLWVAAFPPPGQAWARWDVWEVSESDAVLVASLQLAKALQPMEIGADYLIGVHTDALGVQRVHKYRLSRSVR